MKRIAPLLLAPLLFTLSPALPAQDLPQPDNTAILKELDLIAQGVQTKSQSRRNAAIGLVQSAAASGPSAVDFYLRALENTKYKESAQDFTTWRRNNADMLRSDAVQSAALLQTRYLLLALQRSPQKDALSQIPDTLSYLSQLAEKNMHSANATGKPYPEAQTLTKQSLKDCAIVGWLQIADLLPAGEDFSGSPGNYEEIMAKNIRVPLRSTKDQRLPGTWDTQITTQAALVTASGSQQQADAFNQSLLPTLLFKKAQDTALIGQPNRAISETMLLIRKYPDHPDAKSWIDYVRGLVSNNSSASSAPAPAKKQ